MSFDITET